MTSTAATQPDNSGDDPISQILRTGKPYVAPVATAPTPTGLNLSDPVTAALYHGTPVDSKGNIIDPAATTGGAGASQPAPEETVGRVAGLGERALLKGLGSLVDIPGALSSLADRAGVSGRNYIRGLFGLEPDMTAEPPPRPYGAKAASISADILGLPEPVTPAERVSSAAVQGAPTALLAPEAPLGAALSGATGGASSRTAAELGAGPVGQTIAGITGGLAAAAPSAAAAGTRGLLRGGETGRQAVEDSIADFKAAGTSPTVGQAGNALATKLENTIGSIPGGGPIAKNANLQRQALSNTFDTIADSMSGGVEATPTTAGEALNKGGAATVAALRADSKAAYNAVDTLVPPDTGIDVSTTGKLLQGLTTPTTGAEATTASLISPKLKTLSDNLQTDMQANGGKLPYSAVTKLKSALGDEIDWSPFPTDPANGKLKMVYNSLRDDINAGASAVSPAASNAVRNANANYAANKVTMDGLESIINKNGGPEAVFNAALTGTGPKGGGTVITRAMDAMNDDQKGLFASAVLRRLGTSTPGTPGAAEGAFDPMRFVTNWNKINPDAKSAIFDGLPNNYRQNLDRLANTVDTLKQKGQVLFNPSGTASAGFHAALGLDLLGSIPVGLLHGPHAGMMMAGGGLATAGGANFAARALTSPKIVQWMAQKTAAPTGAIAGAVTGGAQQPTPADNPPPGMASLRSFLQPPQ